MSDLTDGLNKIIWKIPTGDFEDIDEFAEHVVAELDDDYIFVKWDREKQEFTDANR